VTQIVIPDAESFGVRVNHRTPLAAVVSVLRRHNPDASFGQIKAVAEGIRQNGLPVAEVSREASPEPFDSATEPDAVPSAVVDADARASGSEVGAASSAAQPAPGERKPTRAEVLAWIDTLPKRQRPKMSASGRVPAAVLTAYRAAHRDEVLASMVPVEGGAPIPAEPPITEVH